MENNLTIYEKNEFENLEGIIGREMKSFMAVGNALLTIRDQKLYREQFKTFKDYCRDRWGIGCQTAYQLIAAAGVVENVRDCGQIPTCEYQTRPLVPLEPAQQCEIWEEAVRSADGKVVTYKQVKALVDELVGTKPPKSAKKKEPEYEEYSDAVGFAHVAISQLSRIRDNDPRRDEAINMVSDWVEKAKNKKIKIRRLK